MFQKSIQPAWVVQDIIFAGGFRCLGYYCTIKGDQFTLWNHHKTCVKAKDYLVNQNTLDIEFLIREKKIIAMEKINPNPPEDKWMNAYTHAMSHIDVDYQNEQFLNDMGIEEDDYDRYDDKQVERVTNQPLPLKRIILKRITSQQSKIMNEVNVRLIDNMESNIDHLKQSLGHLKTSVSFQPPVQKRTEQAPVTPVPSASLPSASR